MSEYAISLILRHGERADAVEEYKGTYEVSFDPCLTSLGLKQAYTASATIKPYAEKFKKEKIYIYSSPLIRCMQTAAQTILGLGLEKTHKIILQSHLIEEMFLCHFPMDPIKNGLITKKTHEHIRDTFLSGVDFVADGVIPLPYPEEYSQSAQRFADGFYSILERHAEESALVIMVSHGRGLEEFNRYFGESVTSMCKYCGISGVKKQSVDDQWKLFISNKETID